jgi:DNA polymerase-3 subunit alpha
MSAPFIHLHVHSAYSLLDGAIRVGDLVKTAKAMDMPAVALTDHGNMFGVFKFYKEAKKAKIKPIIGCETYITPKSRHRRDQSDPRYHLILLAMNHLGYQNLNRLISLANTEGFYYKPRIDFEILEKYSEGIIASSACLQGQVPRLLLSGQEEEAAKAAKRYADLFPGRFYLELQKNYIPEQDLANQGLIRLAKKLGLPLVATNDCHYLKKTDADSHDVLLCIQTGKTVDDENRMRMSTQEFWFKGPQDMVDLFADVPEAIENTLKIADACDVELPLGQYHFPEFRLEDGESLESKLRQMAQEGFEKRLIEIRETAKGDFGPDQEKEYRDRLAHELDVIVRMGFPGYFLIVADFINYAKQNRIPVGPGRGSAAGSLAAYATGITDIDPIRYGLLFERFLNVERISMPDIDVDFCTDGRDQVIRYVAEKYGGQEHVAQIITFGQLQARAVIKDVGRAMGMPYGEVDKIAKLIPERQKITLEDALKEEPRLAQAARENPQVAQLIETAKSLEALPRHASKHAAGVVIGDRPLVEYLPLYAVSSGVEGEAAKDVVTQFDMKGVEDIGLIKFDFLGLKTLTLIDHILKLIVRAGKPAVDMARLPMDDEEAFKLLCRGDTTGVFQLESSGMREILIKLRPNRFEDIIALVALYRPGPLKSGMVDQFIQRKHGLIPVEYELPQLEPMLAETYGVILYQEQVMQISNVLANYSLGEADLLRRAMGKKIAEVMAEQKGRFMQGARENQLDEKKAGHIFELMANFAEYGFNKSHSAAYALVAYHTAYLKANYPVEFMAALLTAEVSNQDKIVRFIGECREKGITVLPPDINQSDIQFTVVDGRIRFGLAAIKGVGQAAIDSILEARTSRPYTDLFDFCERVDLRRVNRRVIEALIKCGAMDMGGAGRAKMAAALDDALERGARLQKEKEEGQINLFAAMAETDAGPPAIRWPDVPEWRESQRLNYEKEALGFYITGHPLARYERELAALTDTNSEKLKEQADKTRVRMGGMVIKIQQKLTKKGDRMAFVSLEDLTGVAEILVFPDTFKTAQPILETDQPVLVVGETTVDEKGGAATVKIKAFEFHPLESALEKMAKAAVFSISTTGMQPADLGRLKALIESHRGSTPALLKLRVPGAGAAVFKLTTGVRPSRTLLTEARRVFGDSVVELKYS